VVKFSDDEIKAGGVALDSNVLSPAAPHPHGRDHLSPQPAGFSEHQLGILERGQDAGRFAQGFSLAQQLDPLVDSMGQLFPKAADTDGDHQGNATPHDHGPGHDCQGKVLTDGDGMATSARAVAPATPADVRRPKDKEVHTTGGRRSGTSSMSPMPTLGIRIATESR